MLAQGEICNVTIGRAAREAGSVQHHITAAIQTPDTRITPWDVTGKYAVKTEVKPGTFEYIWVYSVEKFPEQYGSYFEVCYHT
jgi:hypothetical protein